MPEAPESLTLLRNELFEICSETPLLEQPSKIATLSQCYPHSIELVEQIQVGLPLEERYECHAFTFSLFPPEVPSPPSGNAIVLTGEFVDFLIQHPALQEIERQALRDHDVLVYFDHIRDSSPWEVKHSGRWEDDRVISKWGTGHVWRHPIWECSACYGRIVRFFRGLEPAAYHRLWEEFLENKRSSSASSPT